MISEEKLTPVIKVFEKIMHHDFYHNEKTYPAGSSNTNTYDKYLNFLHACSDVPAFCDAPTTQIEGIKVT